MKSEDNFFIAHDGVWDGERMIKERIWVAHDNECNVWTRADHYSIYTCNNSFIWITTQN